MLNKTISLLMILCLLTITNQVVFGQSQSYGVETFQQTKTLSKKEFLEKIGVNSADRANQLLDKDSFAKVKKESITAKAMQDADKAQQKKKFVGMNTTTAIVIGAAIAAAIIIVLATKNKKVEEPTPRCDFPPYCNF